MLSRELAKLVEDNNFALNCSVLLSVEFLISSNQVSDTEFYDILEIQFSELRKIDVATIM